MYRKFISVSSIFRWNINKNGDRVIDWKYRIKNPNDSGWTINLVIFSPFSLIESIDIHWQSSSLVVIPVYINFPGRWIYSILWRMRGHAWLSALPARFVVAEERMQMKKSTGRGWFRGKIFIHLHRINIKERRRRRRGREKGRTPRHLPSCISHFRPDLPRLREAT